MSWHQHMEINRIDYSTCNFNCTWCVIAVARQWGCVTMTTNSGNMSGLKSAVVQEGDSGWSNAVICVFFR